MILNDNKNQTSNNLVKKNEFNNLNNIDSINNGKNEFKKIMLNAKHWENEYDFEKVLTLYEKLSELLKELLPSYCEEKIKKKISELKNKINIIIKNGGYYYDSKKSNYYLPGGFQLPENLYNRLYSYEKDGIKWIYSLFREKKCGCILADDEELNKKMQIIGVITGLYYSMKAEKFLLIVPSKKLSNWEKELKRYIALNDLDILIYKLNSKIKENDRQKLVNHINNTSGILITTYDMMVYNYKTLLIKWDFIICDDGCNKINNFKIKRYETLNNIETNFKILLSDNPLPNKFYDIYSIFSYLFKNSNINFGNYNEFKSKFLIKDTKSKNGNIPNEDLQSFMKHFVLRREKNVFYTEYQYEPDKVNTSYEVEDEYDDLNSFIVNDEDYLEEEDIDTNDKNYKNLNFEEDSFKLYSNTNSNLEEENINDELQELRIDNEISKRINDNLINPDQYTKHDHIIDSSNKNMIITTTNNNYDIYENKQCYNKNHHYNEKKCNHCYHIITKNDACISCSNCNNWEHIECSGIPYDKNNIEYFPEIDEYYCHICRKLGHWNYFYLLTKDNKDNKIYDQSLDSKLIKDSNFILQSLQSENLYNIPNNENDDTQINIENNNSDFLNVTGKFGMETSINNLSSIIKEKSFENILYNSNSHENIDNEIINETFLIYQKYIKEFKIYLDKNDQINALNSLLKANKLNSNDLNLHWWIIKIIINLNINISEIIK